MTRRVTVRTKPSEVLGWLYDDINTYGWTKRRFFGKPRKAGNPSPCCVSGGISRIMLGDEGHLSHREADRQLTATVTKAGYCRVEIRVVGALREAMNQGRARGLAISGYNDHVMQTKRQTLAWIKRAIKLAEEKENA